jgi:hypothetical protein
MSAYQYAKYIPSLATSRIMLTCILQHAYSGHQTWHASAATAGAKAREHGDVSTKAAHQHAHAGAQADAKANTRCEYGQTKSTHHPVHVPAHQQRTTIQACMHYSRDLACFWQGRKERFRHGSFARISQSGAAFDINRPGDCVCLDIRTHKNTRCPSSVWLAAVWTLSDTYTWWNTNTCMLTHTYMHKYVHAVTHAL